MTRPRVTCSVCPICGAAGLSRVFPVTADRDELRCAQCGVFFYWPLPTPDEQKTFYEQQWTESGSEYQDHYGDPAYEADNLERNFLPRLTVLEQKGFSGTLLDVGCSVGTFLKAAKDGGWAVHGLDLGDQACTRTAAAVGCPVHCGTLETLNLPDASFDVIHASQVIEHVLDPHAFLDAARRLLKPAGALLLATPVIEPVIFRTTAFVQKIVIPRVSHGRERPFPWAIHYPFHVFVHSSQSLKRLTALHGFEIIHTRTVPWMRFAGMNPKWRAFYHAMNALFRLTNTGMNIDLLAVKRA